MTSWTSGESGRSSGFCARPVHGCDLARSLCVLRGQRRCKAEKEAESSGGVMEWTGSPVDMHSLDALSLRCADTEDRGLEAEAHRPTDMGQCTDTGRHTQT